MLNVEWTEASRTHSCFVCYGGGDVLAIDFPLKCWVYICPSCATQLIATLVGKGVKVPFSVQSQLHQKRNEDSQCQ